MTTIDEDDLQALLHDAASHIAAPVGAHERILAAAKRFEQRRTWRRPILSFRGFRRYKLLLVTVPAITLAVALALVVVTVTRPGSARPEAQSPLRAATLQPGAKGAHRAPSLAPLHSAAAAALPNVKAPAAGTASSLPPGSVGQSSKVEETGSLDLLVGQGKLQGVLDKLSNLATAYGGFVASSQTQSSTSSGSRPGGSIALQIPQQDFTAVLNRAESLGKASSVTTKATDVTGQYVDLQSRIAALQASIQQYLIILSKATSIGDILAVQSQLNNLQSQLEQLQGQQQVLDNETTYSTLTISVEERSSATSTGRSNSGIGSAWHAAISGFVAGVDGAVRIGGPLLFALLCVAILFLGGRWGWRTLRRRIL